MSRPTADQPERLLSSGATDFERRMLEAASRKKPSEAASARMAKALGVTLTTVGSATAATTVASDAIAAKATAIGGTSALSPWVSVGVIGLVVAGAVIGT